LFKKSIFARFSGIIFIFLWAQMVANFENPLLPPFGKGGLGGF
jgi:hypothetical protein